MDQELKQYLDANLARIDKRLAELVTKKDLEAAELVTKKDLEAAELVTKKDLEAAEKRSAASIEKVETSLLGAFYGWARPMEIRVSGMTKTVMGFEERLALAEQRIFELERKRAS
jgi:hypothetical protein